MTPLTREEVEALPAIPGELTIRCNHIEFGREVGWAIDQKLSGVTEQVAEVYHTRAMADLFAAAPDLLETIYALYDRLAALEAERDGAWRVPPGWRLVPDEPTFMMRVAASETWNGDDEHLNTWDIWRAMLAAAPLPTLSPKAERSDG